MIKVLVVDDSKTEATLIKTLLQASPDFEVIGTAKNGEEAVKLVALLKPDLITMDVKMPVMDGFEATRIIMAQNPTPIVVISSMLNDETMDATFLALEAGALSVLQKPIDITSPQFKLQHRYMLDTLRSMAEIKVIRRRFLVNKKKLAPIKEETGKLLTRHFEIVAIGTSIGGPQALKLILEKLPTDFPIPIVIVQHMTPGFLDGFTQWLNQNIALKVKYPEEGERLLGGTVYFAPDQHQLKIERVQGKLTAKLIKGPPINGFCPSATFLLQSIAKTSGKNAVGMLLTGMGNDGAEGLLELKRNQGHTLIQDPDSAVVFGMAGVAQSMGAVDKVVELHQIADYLINIILKKNITV